MALAWLLRFPTVATVLVGVSSLAQLDANLQALNRLDFSAEELTRIDVACAS